MGIPSYFSYIIKNYSNIIRNYKDVKESIFLVQYLFMDCNSIIYDEFHKMEEDIIAKNMSKEDIEKELITNIINKISYYIRSINPSLLVYIAFDGVAPLAKMEQQRNRRFKVTMSNKINSYISNKDSTSPWSTSNITPGTEFMNNLSNKIKKTFLNLEEHFQVKRIIVSGSNERGEGEHKIFTFIRNEKIEKNSQCFVYGLDSDLIMLSLFHCKYFENIYVFRETPEFSKQLISKENENSEFLFLSISTFANAILSELNCSTSDNHRLYDYIFMCFLLGNDFLPHFPSLNIRTFGIDVLIDSYRNLIGKHVNRNFILKNMDIDWKNVLLFLHELSKNEHNRLLNEHDMKNKHSKRKWCIENEDDRSLTIQSVPVIYRSDELYICPSENYWEHRYYKTLFPVKTIIKDICINYLEGLEWVFKYYTSSCPNWKWKYNYHYPPLMKDLIKYIPKKNTTFIVNNDYSFSEFVQLAYVLPSCYHYLLPSNIQDKLSEFKDTYYNENIDYQWAYCRYFWECHACLPDIPLVQLEKWNNGF